MKLHRPTMLASLREEEQWDVCIIGGGATGLGIALEAAASGLRTALIEGRDFAAGTSSRSTKLVHGGVRYLEQGKMSLVSEALKERDRMMANADGHVDDYGFLIPVKRRWAQFYYGMGLRLYDLLAGSHRWGRTEWIGRKEVTRRLPHLAEAGFIGAWRYRDGRFNDAELALGLARTAAQEGAVLVNHCRAEDFLKENDRITGVQVHDALTGAAFTLSAHVVINACGPYSDALCRLDDPAHENELRPSQGIHLVFDADILKGGDALLIPKTDDGRVLFAVPWLGKVLVGTTDTPVDTLEPEPTALEGEIAFVLDHANRFLGLQLKREDIRSVFAGLRPLIQGRRDNTAKLSRSHQVEASASGLVNVRGGKWTTYRKMAEDTIRFLRKKSGLDFEPADTSERVLNMGSARPRAMHPSDARELAAAVALAVEEEMCVTVEDFLARRYRTLFLDARAAAQAAPEVAKLLAAANAENEEWATSQARAFEELTLHYLPANTP
jgi:glycerol-3-phosphate dehydrogenase